MRIPFPFLALSMLFFSVAFNISEARMPEPASMPYSLRGGEPHNPRVAKYYLEELVSEGKMTKEEAERTEVYMIFPMPDGCRILKTSKDYLRKIAELLWRTSGKLEEIL